MLAQLLLHILHTTLGTNLSSSATAATFPLLITASLSLPSLPPTGQASPPGKDKGGEYKITLLLVWASDEPQADKLPKDLDKLLEQLKKGSKKKSFRLEGNASTETLRAGKAVTLKLPDGYEARWSLETSKGKQVVRQVLVNPKKEESVIALKQSPVVNNLEQIKKGKETLLLVVQFEKAAK